MVILITTFLTFAAIGWGCRSIQTQTHELVPELVPYGSESSERDRINNEYFLQVFLYVQSEELNHAISNLKEGFGPDFDRALEQSYLSVNEFKSLSSQIKLGIWDYVKTLSYGPKYDIKDLSSRLSELKQLSVSYMSDKQSEARFSLNDISEFVDSIDQTRSKYNGSPERDPWYDAIFTATWDYLESLYSPAIVELNLHWFLYYFRVAAEEYIQDTLEALSQEAEGLRKDLVTYDKKQKQEAREQAEQEAQEKAQAAIKAQQELRIQNIEALVKKYGLNGYLEGFGRAAYEPNKYKNYLIYPEQTSGFQVENIVGNYVIYVSVWFSNYIHLALIREAGVDYITGAYIDTSDIYQVIGSKDFTSMTGATKMVCVVKRIGKK